MKVIISLLLLLLCLESYARPDQDTLFHQPEPKTDIYKLNYKLDIPVTICGYITSSVGIDLLRKRVTSDPDLIPYLNPKDVWWFDRGAARQNPDDAHLYLRRSNQLMRTFMFMPAILFLDKDVRAVWFDYSLMYVEAQSINSAAYVVGATAIPRMRPYMYNPDTSMERKKGKNTMNSFFSGHTSVVATSTFFMVKVYFDLHPEASNKLLWYTAAAVPPAVAGYFRYRAGKHFPTDIMTGFAVGAMTGILVPEWHRINGGNFCLYPQLSGKTRGLYARIMLN